MAGVAWWNDRGVADHADIVASGDQYDYERRSPWTDDDNAGWGASYSDMEGKIIPGNTFDFPLIHGNAIMAAGSSFYSVSDEVFVKNDFNASFFSVVDLIMGEEKTTADLYDKTKYDFTIYTPDFMNRIKEITSSGASVFMSGSYVGTDLWFSRDSSALRFAADYLHFKPMTGHAVKEGKVYPTDIATPWFSGATEFNTAQTGEVYGAEAPDAIVPADKYSITAFRYTENNTSAGVLHNGKNRTLVLGFPFETIKSETDRNRLMKQALEFLLAN
ncbi:MAG: xanthan lyase, partial [Bacteroidales bacterium]|nr:xanthan lyase [Bacteroidales bacterium]